MSKKRYRSETNCLNCGSNVERKYCPECGQENIEIHDNFFHMAGHFIADYLHYDSKFLQSLRILIAKPGYLTKKYLEGKRVMYIHPLRLFFFITIIMVLLANAYHKKYQLRIGNESSVKISDDEQNKTHSKNDELKEPEIVEKISRGFDNISYYLKYISFFLLPVYAFAFKLLYIRRKNYYVDHLVYTLHLQSFVYLAFCIIVFFPLYLLPAAREWFDIVLIIVSFVYMIISLRFLYMQSWIKTIVKAVLATSFMILVTTLLVAGFIFASFYN